MHEWILVVVCFIRELHIPQFPRNNQHERLCSNNEKGYFVFSTIKLDVLHILYYSFYAISPKITAYSYFMSATMYLILSWMVLIFIVPYSTFILILPVYRTDTVTIIVTVPLPPNYNYRYCCCWLF